MGAEGERGGGYGHRGKKWRQQNFNPSNFKVSKVIIIKFSELSDKSGTGNETNLRGTVPALQMGHRRRHPGGDHQLSDHLLEQLLDLRATPGWGDSQLCPLRPVS